MHSPKLPNGETRAAIMMCVVACPDGTGRGFFPGGFETHGFQDLAYRNLKDEIPRKSYLWDRGKLHTVAYCYSGGWWERATLLPKIAARPSMSCYDDARGDTPPAPSVRIDPGTRHPGQTGNRQDVKTGIFSRTRRGEAWPRLDARLGVESDGARSEGGAAAGTLRIWRTLAPGPPLLHRSSW